MSSEPSYYVDGMESMNAQQYRAALQRKLAAYGGASASAPAASTGPQAVKTADSYMDFLNKDTP